MAEFSSENFVSVLDWRIRKHVADPVGWATKLPTLHGFGKRNYVIELDLIIWNVRVTRLANMIILANHLKHYLARNVSTFGPSDSRFRRTAL